MNKKTLKGRESLNKYLEISGKFYALTDYKSYHEKMDFQCSKCQYIWNTTPEAIQQGKSCIACLGKVLTVDNLQKRVDASGKNITVVNTSGKAGLFTCSCNECSHIWETQTSILFRYNTGGCPSCSKKVRGSTEKLQAMFDDHGNNVKVLGDYVNNSTPVKCVCLDCSEVFYPPASAVMYGSGCPFCCFKGRIPKTPAFLYYVRVTTSSGVFWKIGITGKNNVLDRFTSVDRKKVILLYSHLFEDGATAYYSEQNILRLYKKYLAKNVKTLESGNTEIFTHDVLQMDHLGGRL